MENGKRLDVIQVMRFFCAVCIFVYHSELVGNHGYFGVEMFCIISGFLMMYTTQTKEARKFFMRKRIFRIVPLYWLLTIFTYCIIWQLPQLSVRSEAKPEYLIKSLFFIPFENGFGFTDPILSVGWTLNYEMLFYIVFFVAIHISHKYRGAIACGIIVALVLVGYGMHPSDAVLKFYTDSFLLEFAFGIAVYYMVKAVDRGVMNIGRYKALLSGIALFFLLWLLVNPLSDSQIPRCVRIGVPAMVFVIVILLLYRERTFSKRFVELGNLSFSFYLIEYFASAGCRILVERFGTPLQLCILMVIFVITVLCSYVTYWVVELRFTNWLKGHFCVR